MGRRGPRSADEMLTTSRNRLANASARSKTSAPPPFHLTPSSQVLWSQIIKGRTFEAQDLKTLQCALEALDRAEQARLAILEFGLVFTDGKGMVRSRPEIAVERDSRTAFLRAMRELHLEPPRVPPPRAPWHMGRG